MLGDESCNVFSSRVTSILGSERDGSLPSRPSRRVVFAFPAFLSHCGLQRGHAAKTTKNRLFPKPLQTLVITTGTGQSAGVVAWLTQGPNHRNQRRCGEYLGGGKSYAKLSRICELSLDDDCLTSALKSCRLYRDAYHSRK
jgi:hypothetical protein